MNLNNLLRLAFEEDISSVDLTSEAIFTNSDVSTAVLISKDKGILSGIDVFQAAFQYFDCTIHFECYKSNGDQLSEGDAICTIKGLTKSILSAERVALNLLQRMSGIATMTRACVDAINGTDTRIVDTRKTAPGLRLLDKQAVRQGGGFNHRFNLSDGILIKDNHIKASGSIENAILRAKKYAPHTVKIEVEVESVSDFIIAQAAGADIIMLDNMSNEDMASCVKLKREDCLLEASGNMSLERLIDVAKTGVDLISVGALTHSVKAMDLSLRFE
ncbi:MAG: nicotinate-nucleotide diphosphorylase (carboxylating) [Clostridiales bacterium 38-18]|nr:MAG: nicotinate-nucleotide diphosphorylase (carboxylating) [Clostridiales bacterium 38-18]